MATLERTNNELSRTNKQLNDMNSIISSLRGNIGKVTSQATSAIGNVVNSFTKFTTALYSSLRRVRMNINNIISTFKRIGNRVISFTNKIGNGIKSIIKIFGNLANRVKSTFGILSKDGNILKGTYTELLSAIRLLEKAFNQLENNEFIKSGTGQLAALTKSFDNLKTSIEIGVANLAAKLSTYIVPIINLIQQLISKLFGLFGISTTELTDGISTLNEELGKTSGNLQGFDRVNNISSGSGSSSGLSDEAYKAYLAEFNRVFKEKIDRLLNTEFGKSLTRLYNSLKELAKTIQEVVIPIFNKFYENAIKPLLVSIGDKLIGLIDKLTDRLNNISKWIKNNPEKIKRLFDNITKKAKEFWDAIRGKETLETVLDNQGTLWGEFLQTLVHLHDIAKGLAPILKDLADSFLQFVKDSALPWINEKLADIAIFIDQNKDAIEEILKNIGNLVWDSFKLFVETVIEFIKYIVDNKDKVLETIDNIREKINNVTIDDIRKAIDKLILSLKILLGLQVATWATGLASGLGKVVTVLGGTFRKISSFFGGGAVTDTTAGGAATVGGAATMTEAAMWADLEAQLTAGTFGETITATGGGGAAATGGLSVGAIAAIVAAIVALIAAIVDLWKTSETFRTNVTEVIDSIKEKFEEFKNKVVEAFEPIKEAWKSFYETYSNSPIKPLIEEIVTLIVDVLGGAIKGLISLLGNLFSIIETTIADILNVLSGVVEIVSGVLDVIIGILTLDGERIIKGIKEIGTGIWNTVKNIAVTIIDILKGIFGAIYEVGKDLLSGLWEGIKDSLGGLWEKIKQGFSNLVQKVKDFFGIHSPSTVFADIGKNIVEGLKNGLLNAWSGLVSAFTGKLNELYETVSTKLSNIWSNVKSGISSEIESAKNWVTNGWNTLTGKTSSTTASTIYGHAGGGSIAGGQLFIANEHGNAELIGNIDGTGKTNVANNNMIIDAMSNGIFEGVYNAMAEIASQSSSKINNPGKIEINGFGLIDNNTLRELARLLAPYMNSNNINIADTGFSI